MPSVLVLLLGSDASLANVADDVVAGAKGVRFTEVTVRAVEPDVFRHRSLEADANLAAYDGIVLVAPSVAGGPSFVKLLSRFGADEAHLDTVVGFVGGDASLSAAPSAALADVGGIFVSAGRAGKEDEGRLTGARVAKVAGWVRHALGHESEHAQGGHHHHDHAHGHDHGHRH